MKKNLLVSILCVLVVLLAFAGCSKKEAPAADAAAPAAAADAAAAAADAPAADAAAPAAAADAPAAAPAAAADAPAADAAAPAADAAAPANPEDLKKAAQDIVGFFDGLGKVATESGDDCAKLGTGMLEYLDANKDHFIASMKLVGNISDDFPEAESLKEEFEKLEVATGDAAPHSVALEKCKNTPEVEAFGIAFVGALMAAAPEIVAAAADAAANADAAAPAADAAAVAAPAADAAAAVAAPAADAAAAVAAPAAE